MHTVIHTHPFVRAAEDAGMTDGEVEELTSFIARNPTAGDEIVGTGGCRKVRWRGRGKGKSGGYRTVTFYSGDDMPVFMLTVFGKGEKTTLSMKERNTLGKLTKVLVEEYRADNQRRVVQMVNGR